ncbi:MAG TPA: preprotein translocase subunit SecE [Clostridia bacterium]
MADEVKVTKLNGVAKNTSRLFKEVRSELKKVIWPNRSQLTKSTITVLAMCLIIGIIIWVLDFGLGEGSKAIFKF